MLQPSVGMPGEKKERKKNVFTCLFSLWRSCEQCSVWSSADFAAGFSSRIVFSQKAEITEQSFDFSSIKHELC